MPRRKRGFLRCALRLQISAEMPGALDHLPSDRQPFRFELQQSGGDIGVLVQRIHQRLRIARSLCDTTADMRPRDERRIADDGNTAKGDTLRLQIEDRLQQRLIDHADGLQRIAAPARAGPPRALRQSRRG